MYLQEAELFVHLCDVLILNTETMNIFMIKIICTKEIIQTWNRHDLVFVLKKEDKKENAINDGLRLS